MDPQNPADLQEKLAKIRHESEERVAQRLAKQSGYQYIDLSKTPVVVDALRLIPEAEAREARVASIEAKLKKVALAACDPRLPAAEKIIKDLGAKKYEVKIFIASLSGLEQAWRLYRFVKPEAEEITGKVTIKKGELEKLAERKLGFKAFSEEIKNLDYSKASTTMLLGDILAGALSMHSSDIHFETAEEKAKIRFRIDGLLHDVSGNLPLRNYNGITSRIKLLSGMKINVRGEAQDGRFTINFAKKEIEIRVSVIPSEFGENIVMRILDPDVISIELSGLGIREDDLAIVNNEIKKPNGLILNTGPTGSGKTTTLYAFLKTINSPELKVITLEDPIEYRIEGIEQTQVDEEAGYTFGNGLRAIVRQDPDVILVGEIRDLETADIAMQAALTGHLVLSTLHTNDAVGTVPRLVNLGVKPITIGPALSLVIAQRLVRRLCSKCRKPVDVSGELKTKISGYLVKLPQRVERKPYEDPKIYEAVGCESCSGFGYKGRIGIFEFLESGPDLEETILKEFSEVALRKLAERQGMVTMQADGVLKVLQGETTFKEVESVTGPIEW